MIARNLRKIEDRPTDRPHFEGKMTMKPHICDDHL